MNEFLITLGRDVSGPGAHISRHQHSQSMSQSAVDEASFFDPANLAQLGLAGMPGVPSAPGPGSGASYHGEAGFMPMEDFSHHAPSSYAPRTQHPVQPVHFGMYASAQDIAGPAQHMPYAGARARVQRASATDERVFASPPFAQAYPAQAYPAYLTPPLEPGASMHPGASPLSSHSGMSTPPNSTPPHIPMTVAPESATVFDFLRSGRAPPPVAQLNPVDYGGKITRNAIHLKSAGPQPQQPSATASASPSSSSAASAAELATTRPEPVEPKLDGGARRRGPPARFTASDASSYASSSSSSIAPSKSSPLYPLLTSGDAQFKLPPLGARFREPSPSPPLSASGSSSVSSRETTVSPTLPPRSPPPAVAEERVMVKTEEPERAAYPVLPSIRSLAGAEELARGVGRIELGGRAAEERRRHAVLLRDMLVAINTEYKRRYGTPPPPAAGLREAVRGQREEVRGLEREVRDVEMIAV